jgi:hypothetical protein
MAHHGEMIPATHVHMQHISDRSEWWWQQTPALLLVSSSPTRQVHRLQHTVLPTPIRCTSRRAAAGRRWSPPSTYVCPRMEPWNGHAVARRAQRRTRNAASDGSSNHADQHATYDGVHMRQGRRSEGVDVRLTSETTCGQPRLDGGNKMCTILTKSVYFLF